MRKIFFLVICLAVLAPSCASRRSKAPEPAVSAWDGSVASKENSRVHPTVGTRGMVVSDDREASEFGAEIMRRGGNAIDATVATAFVMAVTRPHYASLGGGGFLLYCPKPSGGRPGSCEVIDYRERAPGRASRDMYVRDGKPRTDLSQDGALAIGVPGVPAGLFLAHEKWGKLSRATLLSRALNLARDGIRVSGNMEYAAFERWDAMNDEAKRIFGCGTKKGPVPTAPCRSGELLKQPDLALTIELISRSGSAGFYRGPVARKMVDGIRDGGGIMSVADLESYRPSIRVPISGTYSGMEIVTMPPPSAGGALIVQMFGFMERADRQGALSDGLGSARSLHAITHAMALSFADRAEVFGDPDFVSVPLEKLLSSSYIDERWKTFDQSNASLPSGSGFPSPREGMHTTHFSVIDADGNAVAVTTTVNDNFGSGFVPPGTGVVMNNEMDDFSIQPGVPNLFGLVGTEANSVAPGKRPLSSMSPTVVRDAEGNARIVIGAAGGPRITTSVFLSLFNRLRFGLSLPDAVAAPRVHHQWKPLELRFERNGFAAETLGRLESMGYALQPVTVNARVHALERFPNGRTWGVPDTRAEGAAVAE